MTAIRPARASDAPALARIAVDAYSPYIAAIGREPPPLRQDFPADIAEGACWVAGDPPDGYVVAREKAGDWLLENVAVAPRARGTGLGRALIGFAEAEGARRGFARIVLYTHAKMTRNLDLYPRLGYRQTGRRTEAEMNRVFFEKALG